MFGTVARRVGVWQHPQELSVGVAMDYRVSLDMYNGPMDLLLYLIRENEVDIYDIPVAEITDQYMKYLEVLELIDPNVVGDFLVMAATLAEIKSRMLLPPSEQEGEEGQAAEDPRMELVRQLMEYKRYKEMAAELGEMADIQARRFSRPLTSAGAGGDAAEVDLSEINVWDLFRSFTRLMKATLGGLPRTIVDSDIPLYQQMELIVRMLRAQGIITFLSVFERCKDRIQAVGAFIAVLELARRGVIGIEQSHDADEIRIRMRDEERFATLLDELRRPVGHPVPSTPTPQETQDHPQQTIEQEESIVAQGPPVTVLATGSENCLLYQERRAGLRIFIDFGVRAGEMDQLDEMLGLLGSRLAEVNAILITQTRVGHYDPTGLAELLRRRAENGAGPLRLYIQESEPGENRPTDAGVEVVPFGEEAFEVEGVSGTATVQPVKLTDSPGICGFRIGADYVGGGSSLKEVFSDRVLDLLGAYGADPVKRVFLHVETASAKTTGGSVGDLIAAMERPELKQFFEQLEQLTCLGVAQGDSGGSSARLITETRDRLGFRFQVPVVPPGMQNPSAADDIISEDEMPDAPELP